MPYLQKRNNKTSVIKKAGIALLVAGVLIFAGSFLSMSPLALTISRPLFYVATQMGEGVSHILGLLRHGDEYNSIELLKTYERSLRETELSKELLIIENDMLRRELGLRKNNTEDGVYGAVLSHPPLTPFDTLVIDTKDITGIQVGKRVFAGDNVFIGTVKSSSDSTALIELLSNSGRKTEGILARTETAVVLEGIGGGAFEFIVPEAFDVEPGDLVVTPGSDRFAIARVVQKQVDENGSFVNILLEQLVNFKTLQWVRINTK